jgi:hypothetical protein
MDRLRSAVVGAAAAAAALGLAQLGEGRGPARAGEPWHAAPSAAVEAAPERPGCLAAPSAREPGAFCTIDSGPPHPRRARSGA